MASLFEPFGLETTGASIMGIFFVTVGAVACFAIGVVLDRTHKYLLSFRTICFAICIIQAAGSLFVTDKHWTAALYTVLLGACVVPIVPATFALSCELTHPLSPAAVVGVLTTVSNFSLFAVVFIYNDFLVSATAKGSKELMLFWAGQGLLAGLLSLFIKEDLRRVNAGKQENAQLLSDE